VRRGWVHVGAIALVVLVACSRRGSSVPFEPADLASIELTAKDAPSGLGYVPGFSGDQDLDAFARDAAERTDLIDDGFELGNGALFVPADRVNGGHLAPHDPIVQGIAAVFAGANGASSALHRFLEDVRTRQLPGARDGTAPGFGDESYRLEGTNSDGASVTVVAWRRGNVILTVLGTSFDPDRVLTLAEMLDGRATAAANPS
jgi:hypothetical protein